MSASPVRFSPLQVAFRHRDPTGRVLRNRFPTLFFFFVSSIRFEARDGALSFSISAIKTELPLEIAGLKCLQLDACHTHTKRAFRRREPCHAVSMRCDEWMSRRRKKINLSTESMASLDFLLRFVLGELFLAFRCWLGF